MAVDFDLYRKTMDALEYPPNHKFDPETFEPIGITIERINTITRHAPELILGSGTLLDVGCNKGLISFYLRGRYTRITAVDPLKEWIDFANKLKEVHGIKNIDFLINRFEYLPEDSYNVIHFGQCSHYLYRDEIRRMDIPLTFIRKAARMARDAIVIDGTFGIDDPSPKFDSEKDHWNDDVKRGCTIEAYCMALRPDFKLVRYIESGSGNTRRLAVFVRVK